MLSYLQFICFLSGIKKNYTIKKADEVTIKTNGELTEDIWQNAIWETGFIQYQPREGEEPCQQTKFIIIQSNKNLYIGIRATDNNPDKISVRTNCLDNLDGERVQLLFDGY